MNTTRFARYFALPIVSAGIIGGRRADRCPPRGLGPFAGDDEGRCSERVSGRTLPDRFPGPRESRTMSKRVATALLACGVLLALCSPAAASWNGNGSGPSYAKARSLPAPAAPTTSVTGRNVTVSWTAPGGAVPVTGYLVKRYNGSDVEQTVLAGCTGTIATTSCTENAVPAGSWRYTVTAVRGNWRGSESPRAPP